MAGDMQSISRFGWRLWRWANANENLFELTPDEMDWFKRLTAAATVSEYLENYRE